MTITSVGIEEVRAAVNVALDELQESLRKVNQEVSLIRHHYDFSSEGVNFSKSPTELIYHSIDLVKPRARVRGAPCP
jgi:hypothetical protein